ncbi:DHA2 family efflux MFS transporter permease subunit [Streptomyces sp. NPDC048644]|uniref:DHA2 family efflux MFS transporter permease subunit n=1 Tax=Streptomyces sp. NPDC048644 TaxID=3365582 RepID=UPI00371A72EF
MTETAANSAPAETSADPAGSARRWWALAMLSGAQLMVALDMTIVSIALPTAQADVHLSDASKGWVITAYTLAFGGLLMLGGRLGDVLGRRRAVLIGVAGFAAASVLGGAASNATMLIAARALQGVFAALLTPSTLALLTSIFSEGRERAKALGLYGAALMSGGAVGLLLGGAIAEYLNWRWTLYVNVPIALAVIVGGLRLFPDPPRPARVPLDVVGAALGCAGIVGCIYAFGEAGARGWGSGVVIGSLAAGLVLLVVFAVVQSRVTHPLLPPRVLADRNRAGAFLTIVISTFAMLGMFLFMTFQFQDVMRYSSLKAGLAFLPYVVVAAVISTRVTGRIMPHVRPRVLLASGLAVEASGLLVLTRLTPDSGYATSVLPALLLFGISVGLLVAPIMSTATTVSDPADTAIASAFVNTSQQIGGSIGTALLNSVAAGASAAYLATHAHAPRSWATVHGMTVACGWAAGVLAVGAVVVAFLVTADPRVAPGGAAPKRKTA